MSERRLKRPLRGRVAVVTGATRGAGLAIAEELGAVGATVYVTGRTQRGAVQPDGLPGTVEDAAEAVIKRGGRGHPVLCDHADDAQVAALFERVADENDGRLDLLVNNVWAGYEGHDGAGFTAPFWEQPLDKRWRDMFEVGLRAHMVASRAAVPLLMARRGSLVVHTIAWAFGAYLGNLYYDVAKAAMARLAFGLAHELREHGVASVALAPGFMRTERVMAAHAAEPFDLSVTESPTYLGRAVVALASDPEVLQRSGELLTVGELARDYGFTDVDGTQPQPFRLPDA